MRPERLNLKKHGMAKSFRRNAGSVERNNPEQKPYNICSCSQWPSAQHGRADQSIFAKREINETTIILGKLTCVRI